jgi:hypothetical protein
MLMPAGRVYVCLLLAPVFAPPIKLGGIVYDAVAPLSIVPGDFPHPYYLQRSTHFSTRSWIWYFRQTCSSVCPARCGRLYRTSLF